MRHDRHLFEKMPEWNVFRWMAGLLCAISFAIDWTVVISFMHTN
jgi:hypothetical protein